MKNFIKSFREIGNQNKGWLGIKRHYIAFDIQKHLVVGPVVYLLACLFSAIVLHKVNYVAIQTGFGILVAVVVGKEVIDFILFKLGKKANWNPIPDIIAGLSISFIAYLVMRFLIFKF